MPVPAAPFRTWSGLSDATAVDPEDLSLKRQEEDIIVDLHLPQDVPQKHLEPQVVHEGQTVPMQDGQPSR